MKKLIYAIEREHLELPGRVDEEHQPLLDAQQEFIDMLDHELEKIVSFYTTKESQLALGVRELQEQLGQLAATPSAAPSPSIEPPVLSAQRTLSGPASPLGLPAIQQQPRALSEPQMDTVSSKQRKSLLSKHLIELFVELSNLKEFVSLNQTGFAKILKKYEKVTGQTLKKEYLAKVQGSLPFLDSTKESLDQSVSIVLECYASLVTQGNVQLAKEKLLAHVHERVVFYRNTIWKDMVELERKKETVGLKPASVVAQSGDLFVQTKFTFMGRIFHVPVLPKRLWLILVGMVAFGLIVAIPVFDSSEQNNCFAILVFASYLWALEVCDFLILYALATSSICHRAACPFSCRDFTCLA